MYHIQGCVYTLYYIAGQLVVAFPPSSNVFPAQLVRICPATFWLQQTELEFNSEVKVLTLSSKGRRAFSNPCWESSVGIWAPFTVQQFLHGCGYKPPQSWKLTVVFLNLKVMGLEFRAKTKVLVHAAPEALHVALHCTLLDFYSHISSY